VKTRNNVALPIILDITNGLNPGVWATGQVDSASKDSDHRVGAHGQVDFSSEDPDHSVRAHGQVDSASKDPDHRVGATGRSLLRDQYELGSDPFDTFIWMRNDSRLSLITSKGPNLSERAHSCRPLRDYYEKGVSI
jgi:hypothetical protein